MPSNPRFEAGDVKHVTRFTLGAGKYAYPTDAWAVATDNAYVDFVHGYDPRNTTLDGICWMLSSGAGDQWDLAPPDEWPDEVCAAVALYKMGIEQ